MFLKCSTCLEAITPSQDLSNAPCGHVFHYICILQWINTGKRTCPQCRASCQEKQLRKVFFSECDDLNSTTDANELQSQIDSLNFNLRITKQENKKLQEDADQSKAQAISIREEFRELEREKKALSGKIIDLKTQIRYFQTEKNEVEVLRNELQSVKNSLKLYQNIEIIVKGTVSEVNKKLHEIGDFSQASKELGILIVALKRELEASKTENQNSKADLRQYASLIKELKSTVTLRSKEIKELTVANNIISSDLKHSEEEKDTLKDQIRALQSTLDAHSDNARSRMKIINSEYSLATQNMEETQLLDKLPSPMEVKTKVCSLVGLKRSADTEVKENKEKERQWQCDFNILKKSRLNSHGSGVFSQLETKSFNQVNEKFYDGFGGHGKMDVFPTAKIDSVNSNGIAPKRPRKGVAKVFLDKKTATKTLDKYFNLDTP
ncbi:E3 ubiquitin-protein ligase trul-1-like [Lepeophtheirus salmonis]|uniref:TRAFinteracting proteinlike [Megachile rotundata] n=1 Tax=Lepeophtheirus salmonis TaxID=72036 RepID=A0A0K2TDU3_LEPSM|nr:E3 ubiquitin-protein ligase TRAIP-like [Lepeophtheirus salmonis]